MASKYLDANGIKELKQLLIKDSVKYYVLSGHWLIDGSQEPSGTVMVTTHIKPVINSSENDLVNYNYYHNPTDLDNTGHYLFTVSVQNGYGGFIINSTAITSSPQTRSFVSRRLDYKIVFITKNKLTVAQPGTDCQITYHTANSNKVVMLGAPEGTGIVKGGIGA